MLHLLQLLDQRDNSPANGEATVHGNEDKYYVGWKEDAAANDLKKSAK